MSVERLDLGDAGSNGMALRWRREDYDVVKHDNCFSEWKVLVSGADWKEQVASRGSGERIRSRNLPSPQVGAGVYELGVTLPAWKIGDSSTLKSEDIVVVYVGYADHIRKRLLRYCQAGSYVEGSRSPTSTNLSTSSRMDQWNRSPLSSKQSTPQVSPRSNSAEEPMMNKQKYSISDAGRPPIVNRNGRRSSRLEKQLSFDQRGPLSPIAEPESDGGGRSGSPRGPRLFSEVFTLGCSIAYRWASTKSKDDAEYVVSELTDAFDYAWNRGGNSDVRSQDILQKIVLGKRGLHDSNCCSRNSSKWRFLFRKKPVGIKIIAYKPPPEPRMRRRPRRSSSDISRSRGLCIMLLRSRPHLTIVGGSSKSSKHSEFTKIDIPVDRCGVLLENGLVCNALPQKGRKRCHMHFDARKPPRRKTSQVASSQDSRSGSLASEGTTSIDSLRLGLGLQGSMPRTSSSCFPFLATKKPKPQVEQPRKRGSVSFSTWLSRSELLKAKSLEWLLAMEEIKGRGNNNNNSDCSTSPILKPVVLSPETNTLSQADFDTPVKAGRISLNLNQSMGMAPPVDSQDVYRSKVDDGMLPTIVSRRSSVRWPPAPLRETYATSYNPPQFPRISFS
ncbi:hypothetical protein KC19_7G114300 [Ceratodon purpureus]|uniref:Uncharacterized protein n=1 Tax=Ceratodon purpureus TaxID=3225 RepID=A0A8T0H8L4_CERPU|nr:hypothetical protein KC19_7G114300 [Ceratodon purpureus]